PYQSPSRPLTGAHARPEGRSWKGSTTLTITATPPRARRRGGVSRQARRPVTAHRPEDRYPTSALPGAPAIPLDPATCKHPTRHLTRAWITHFGTAIRIHLRCRFCGDEVIRF